MSPTRDYSSIDVHLFLSKVNACMKSSKEYKSTIYERIFGVIKLKLKYSVFRSKFTCISMVEINLFA